MNIQGRVNKKQKILDPHEKSMFASLDVIRHDYFARFEVFNVGVPVGSSLLGC